MRFRRTDSKVEPLGGRPREEELQVVPNHRFEPGTLVYFLPAHTVTVERSAGREPFARPIATATVDERGELKVPGSLAKGLWCVAGPVGDRWSYVQFSVK